MWRPEGWTESRAEGEGMLKTGGIPLTGLKVYRDAYEAGADAMLKALFKLAEESPTKTFVIDSRVINI